MLSKLAALGSEPKLEGCRAYDRMDLENRLDCLRKASANTGEYLLLQLLHLFPHILQCRYVMQREGIGCWD